MVFEKYENLPNSIVVSDAKLTIIYVNEATVKIFGYSKNELIGSDVKILMLEKTVLKHDRYVDNYNKGHKPIIIGTIGKNVLGKTKDDKILKLFLSIEELFINNEKKYVASFKLKE